MRACRSDDHHATQQFQTGVEKDVFAKSKCSGIWTLASLSLRLKDLLGPVMRVKKKKRRSI